MALSLTKQANASATGAITPNATLGGCFEYTLVGNVTLAAPSGIADAQLISFFIKGPASGQFSVTFATAYVQMGARLLGVGDVLMVAFIYNGGLLLPIGDALFQVDRSN